MRDLLALLTPAAAGTAVCLGLLGVVGHHHLHGAAHTALLLGGLAVVTVAVTAALLVVSHGVARHRALAIELRRVTVPRVRHGIAVREGATGEVAFVAGLWRPTIFVDPALLDRLPTDQQRAVLLHERAHQRRFDPWWSQLDASVGRLRHAARWRGSLERRTARREIAADRWAVRAGASRTALAGALLTSAPGHHVGVSAFPPAAELRVRALLGDPVDVSPLPPTPLLGALLGVAAVVACASWWHPTLGW